MRRRAARPTTRSSIAACAAAPGGRATSRRAGRAAGRAGAGCRRASAPACAPRRARSRGGLRRARGRSRPPRRGSRRSARTSGLAADARSTNSSTAGAVRARASESGDAGSWVASGSTSYTRSPRTRSTTRLVTRKAASGAIVYSWTRIGAALTICSKLSSTNSIRRLSSASARRSSSCKPVVSRMPSAYPIVDSSSSGSSTFSSGTKTMPSGKSARGRLGGGDRQPALADPPGPTSVTSRVLRSPRSATMSSIAVVAADDAA